jgi:hypothetical protein
MIYLCEYQADLSILWDRFLLCNYSFHYGGFRDIPETLTSGRKKPPQAVLAGVGKKRSNRFPWEIKR